MPWWLILYLGGFAAFTALWMRAGFRDGDSKVLLILEFLSNACMVLVALGYWLAPVRSLLGTHASVAFAAGLASLILTAVRDLRETLPDPEMSFRLNVAAALTALALYVAVCGPLLYWGYRFAVLGKTGGN